jgi:hypothetical protein
VLHSGRKKYDSFGMPLPDHNSSRVNLKRRLQTAAQVLFLAWVILINYAYYLQFKALIAARLRHLVRLWR